MLVSAKDHNTKEMELFINLITKSQFTIQEHPTNEVKLRKCELSTSTGKCGYRTLNFKIIPSELESLGKKVCVDDHGSQFSESNIFVYFFLI
jgi:hypothetical protein